MNVIAIIAAFNEADIIGPVITHLIEEGVSVYVIDNHSSDATAAIAAGFVGRGVIGIERFPESVDKTRDRFDWRTLLRRKEALAGELNGDWFLHQDADEFRESPWPDLHLADAIARVDAAGYNAIDFELMEFPPTSDSLPSGADPRPVFRHFEPARDYNKRQVKCWKRTNPIDLVSSGGHDVQFEGRSVFPIRFLLRHYPVRSQLHGEQKVFVERKPRLAHEERGLGWHVQYDDVSTGHRFIRDPSSLTRYDPDAARLHVLLHHRGIEELEARVRDCEGALAEMTRRADFIEQQLAVARGRVEGLLQSGSWRLTAPLRAVLRVLIRLRRR